MPRLLQPHENIALSLVFEMLGEIRINRTSDEYMAITARLPALKVLEYLVNEALQKFNKTQQPEPGSICHFRAGDLKPRYGDFPTKLSIETIRNALIYSGMRNPTPRRRRTA